MLPQYCSRVPLLIRGWLASILILLCASRAQADSVLLDGVNDHVALGHDSALAIQQFTIETWFKRQIGGGTVTVNVTSSYPLIVRGNAANYFLGTDASGKLHGQVMGTPGGRVSLLAPSAVPVDEWHHGAFSYDGSTLRLYVDGVQVAEKAAAMELSITPEGTRLGQVIYQGQTYGSWKGWIDEARIWNRALSPAELAQNRFAAITFAPGLLARWGFDDSANLSTNSDGARRISSTLANGASYSTDVPPLGASGPLASLSSPVSPLSVTPGTPVQFAASASDPDGTVAKVEFYANHTKIGEDATAPYEMEWVPDTHGIFVVRAVAEDNTGLRNGTAGGLTVGVMPAVGNEAVFFDGDSAYADAGNNPQSELQRFTVETRFFMDGSGKPVPLGNAAIPCVTLVSRGSTAYDTNYLLGIRPSDNRLVAGFGDSLLFGRTAITRGEWHHAAVTYDGEALRLFLDGALESEVLALTPPLAGGVKRLTFGARSTSNYVTGPTFGGIFHGALDEVRIWNHPRSIGSIAGAMHSSVPNAPGLVSRWPMDGIGGGTLLATGNTPLDAVITPNVVSLGNPAVVAGSVPTVSLDAPSAEVTIARDTVLNLQATANDADGPVQRVEFWSQLGKLGEDAEAPFSFNWSAAPVGTHWVCAVAIDATGAAGTSQTVRVNVTPPPGAGALYFDGVGDLAGAGGDQNFQFTGGKFTAEAWFRREGIAQTSRLTSRANIIGGTILALSTFNDLRAIVGIRASDNVLVGVFQTASDLLILEGSTPVGTGVWQHAAMTCDGNRFRVYLDGVLHLEGDIARPLPDFMYLLLHVAGGPESDSRAYFRGFIDEVRLWNHDRTGSEIAGARAQQFATADGLISRWTFSEGTGITSAGTGSDPRLMGFANNNTTWTTGLPPPTGVPPSVTIQSPAAQAIFPISAPFQVSVAANDADGAVQKVELYLGSIKVGEDTSAPYDFVVVGQEIGLKHLRAVATDNQGLTSTHRVALQMFPPTGGEGLYFDGVDDSVRMPADAPLATERFTIEAWVCRDGSGTQSTYNTGIVPLVARGGLNLVQANYVLGVRPDTGKLVARIGDTQYSQPSVTLVGNTALPFGEWRHVAVTYDGVALRLYVDGQADGSIATSIIPAAAAGQHTMLGSWPISQSEQSGAFHGYLDEVRIWNHARGQAAIAADRWRAVFNDPGLLARWAMDEGSGTQIASTGSVAATGTISGARWTIGHPASAAPVPVTNLTAGSVPHAGGSATLTAAATGNISRVEFYVNGIKIGESTSAPWSIDFTPTSPGRYVINVVTTTTTGATGASNDLVWDVAPIPGNDGIYLDGIDDFVEAPATDEFSLASFTAETWFRCDGPGRAGVYSSNGPIAPILAMGRWWYIGVRPTDGRIVAGSDSFAAGEPSIVSISPIEYGKWCHVALTGGPSGLRLYVDGVFQPFGTSGPVSFFSAYTLSIGTAMAPEVGGSFHGSVDETRIWSVAREQADIAADRLKEIHNASGLVARWSSVAGGVVVDSGSSSLHARLKNGAQPTAGVSLMKNPPPAITLLDPPHNAVVSAPVPLKASVTGETGEVLSAEFLGREIPRDAGDFTIAVLPDLTNYITSTNGGAPSTLNAMLDWIVANRVAKGIVCVAQTGGIAPVLDSTRWAAASQAFTRLDDPATTGLPFGIPFGLAPGSDATFHYQPNFGTSRYGNKPWYVAASDKSAALFFRAGGVDMGVLLWDRFESSQWIEDLQAAHPQRQFVIVTQGDGYLDSTTSPNRALILRGGGTGESRSVTASGGSYVSTLSAEFNARPNGGDGWMRLLTFSPLRGQIRVQTYSPTLGIFETDADSDFTVRWNSPLLSPDAVVGTATGLSTGDSAQTLWTTPESGRRYAWHAAVTDGVNRVPGPVREFSTGSPVGGEPPSISLLPPINGVTATLPCVIPLTAQVTLGSDPIERVEFLVNGLPLHSMANGPFDFYWSPGGAGNYAVSAAVVDRRGRRQESAPIQIAVAPRPATTIGVSVSSPSKNATLYDAGVIPITAVLEGTAVVSYVDFYVDGAYLGRDTSAPFSFPWSYSGPGPRDLQLLAVSDSLQSAISSTVRVNVTPLVTSTITRQPYVQMASPQGVTICWRSSETHPARVRFGKTLGALASIADESVPATDHAVRLTGLEPNTRYYYGVGTHGSMNAGNDSNTYFTTPPLPGRAKPTRIWALGTFGFSGTGQTSTRDAYVTYTGARGTDVMLMLGDGTSLTGADSEYQSTFNTYASVLRRTCAWPTLGNHETNGSSTHNPAIAYYSVFQLPTGGECGGIASGTEQYYSFDYGNIHFVCLDSMTSDRSGTGAMTNWLRADLAATQARWKLAFWHHPPYSKGSANSDTVTRQIEMRTNIVPILEQFGVDLVLCGDGRNYQRSWFMADHYGPSSTFSDLMKKSSTLGRRLTDGPYLKPADLPPARNGAVYMVSGNASALDPAGTPALDHPAMAVNLKVLGTMVIDVNGPQMDVRMLQASGTETDTFSIYKPYSTTDSDGDQLPDDFELEHGLDPATLNPESADTDADGTTDLFEFRAGTSPTDPTSRFAHLVSKFGSTWRVTFPTVIGMRYRVEYSDNLTATAWTQVGAEVAGTGNPAVVTDATFPPPSKRFYRVIARP